MDAYWEGKKLYKKTPQSFILDVHNNAFWNVLEFRGKVLNLQCDVSVYSVLNASLILKDEDQHRCCTFAFDFVQYVVTLSHELMLGSFPFL